MLAVPLPGELRAAIGLKPRNYGGVGLEVLRSSHRGPANTAASPLACAAAAPALGADHEAALQRVKRRKVERLEHLVGAPQIRIALAPPAARGNVSTPSSEPVATVQAGADIVVPGLRTCIKAGVGRGIIQVVAAGPPLPRPPGPTARHSNQWPQPPGHLLSGDLANTPRPAVGGREDPSARPVDTGGAAGAAALPPPAQPPPPPPPLQLLASARPSSAQTAAIASSVAGAAALQSHPQFMHSPGRLSCPTGRPWLRPDAREDARAPPAGGTPSWSVCTEPHAAASIHWSPTSAARGAGPAANLVRSGCAAVIKTMPAADGRVAAEGASRKPGHFTTGSSFESFAVRLHLSAGPWGAEAGPRPKGTIHSAPSAAEGLAAPAHGVRGRAPRRLPAPWAQQVAAGRQARRGRRSRSRRAGGVFPAASASHAAAAAAAAPAPHVEPAGATLFDIAVSGSKELPSQAAGAEAEAPGRTAGVDDRLRGAAPPELGQQGAGDSGHSRLHSDDVPKGPEMEASGTDAPGDLGGVSSRAASLYNTALLDETEPSLREGQVGRSQHAAMALPQPAIAESAATADTLPATSIARAELPDPPAGTAASAAASAASPPRALWSGSGPTGPRADLTSRASSPSWPRSPSAQLPSPAATALLQLQRAASGSGPSGGVELNAPPKRQSGPTTPALQSRGSASTGSVSASAMASAMASASTSTSTSGGASADGIASISPTPAHPISAQNGVHSAAVIPTAKLQTPVAPPVVTHPSATAAGQAATTLGSPSQQAAAASVGVAAASPGAAASVGATTADLSAAGAAAGVVVDAAPPTPPAPLPTVHLRSKRRPNLLPHTVLPAAAPPQSGHKATGRPLLPQPSPRLVPAGNGAAGTGGQQVAPRDLTASLFDAPSWVHVAHLVHRWPHALNAISVTAAFKSLSKCCSPEMLDTSRSDAPVLLSMLQHLCFQVEEHLPSMGPREVATVLFSAATLGYYPPSQLTEAMVGSLLGQLQAAKNIDCSQTVWALERLGWQLEPHELQTLWMRMQARYRNDGPSKRSLMVMLSAATKMGLRFSAEQLRWVEAVLVERQAELSAQDVANSLSSMARLVEAEMEQADQERRYQAMMQQQQQQRLERRADGGQQRGRGSKEGREELQQQGQQHGRVPLTGQGQRRAKSPAGVALQGQSLAPQQRQQQQQLLLPVMGSAGGSPPVVASTSASAGHQPGPAPGSGPGLQPGPHPGPALELRRQQGPGPVLRPKPETLLVLMKRCWTVMPSLRSDEAVMCLYSLVRMRFKAPERFTMELVRCCIQHRASCTDFSISLLVWSAGRLGALPLGPWAGSLLDEVLRRLPGLTPAMLATALHGLAELRLPLDPPQVAALLSRTTQCLPYFSAQEVANAAWALAYMPYDCLPSRGSALWTALTERVQKLRFGSFSPQGLANLLWGLAVLTAPTRSWKRLRVRPEVVHRRLRMRMGSRTWARHTALPGTVQYMIRQRPQASEVCPSLAAADAAAAEARLESAAVPAAGTDGFGTTFVEHSPVPDAAAVLFQGHCRRELWAALNAHLGALNAVELSMTMWAARKMRLGLGSRWLRVVARRATAEGLLRELPLRGLSALVHALTWTPGYVPCVDLVDALELEVVRRLSEIVSPRTRRGLLSRLTAMRAAERRLSGKRRWKLFVWRLACQGQWTSVWKRGPAGKATVKARVRKNAAGRDQVAGAAHAATCKMTRGSQRPGALTAKAKAEGRGQLAGAQAAKPNLTGRSSKRAAVQPAKAKVTAGGKLATDQAARAKAAGGAKPASNRVATAKATAGTKPAAVQAAQPKAKSGAQPAGGAQPARNQAPAAKSTGRASKRAAVQPAKAKATAGAQPAAQTKAEGRCQPLDDQAAKAKAARGTEAVPQGVGVPVSKIAVGQRKQQQQLLVAKPSAWTNAWRSPKGVTAAMSGGKK